MTGSGIDEAATDRLELQIQAPMKKCRPRRAGGGILGAGARGQV
jgi:hypothetical protein